MISALEIDLYSVQKPSKLTIKRQPCPCLSGPEEDAQKLKEDISKAGSDGGMIALGALVAGVLMYAMFGGRSSRSLTA